MALMINENCVNCDACLPECPTEAITDGSDVDVSIYYIHSKYCTECVGYHDDPQCVIVCPVDCIIPDPDNVESQEELQAKYETLN